MRRSIPTDICGLPLRLFVYVIGAIGLALPALGLASTDLIERPPSLSVWGGILLFLVLALGADFRPVPLDEQGNEVSLAFVFIIAALLIFGWRVAIPLAAFSVLLPELSRDRPLLRALFNSATYALATAGAILPTLVVTTINRSDPERLTAAAFLCGAVYVVINVVLVAGAASLAADKPLRTVLAGSIRQGGGAFGIMAFLAALAANLWVLKPLLLVLLAGPLFSLTLYQRSALRSRLALRDANTDNLTGLGNHRAYQAALRSQVEQADRTGQPFSLCLIDLDDFKPINDVYGHPTGDEVLVGLAELLKRVKDATAFRFGGDEFALLLGADDAGACIELEALQREFAAAVIPPSGSITISAGIATYPRHAGDPDSLHQVADGALYWSKRHGKNQACIYSPNVVRIHSTADLEREAERGARLQAATNLVRFLDAKDPSTANHSEIVSTLAAAIGAELALDEETIDQLRLAGLLHDLGKIGVPDSILQAPRPLTEDEFAVVRRHPEIGHSLLRGIDLAPIDDWIIHHHERWDGQGYPQGLAGEKIPLGARIIHAADAFEAMTANRPYGQARSPEWALAELHDKSGTQFDPAVVEAFSRCLTSQLAEEAAAHG